jgi:hypothetical protein
LASIPAPPIRRAPGVQAGALMSLTAPQRFL